MERKFHVSNRKSVSRVRSSRRRPGCIRLFVCPTTGGRLEISVSPRETILGLKAALARKLRILPIKITLTYKDKVLKEGCIQDYQIPHDSHVTLLPNMESGLSVHHPDKSVMKAVENLTETQVNDFLSGRSPLMLAIQMGENMVFVQLQLSMLQAQGQRPPQPRPTTPATATVLSQSGLSPASIAEATRYLSQRLHTIHEMNVGSSLHPSTSTATSLASQLCQSPMSARPTDPPALAASTPAPAASSQTRFHHVQNLSSLPENSGTSPPPSSPGAVINTMKHLGRGVYTGTFQGTLDPSLQDGNGHPRRSVNTILHILNDLLVAAPHSPVPGGGQGQAAVTTQAPCPCHNTSLPLTPPSSPVNKICSATETNLKDDSENTKLRDKMLHIQTMLAQRKAQRKEQRRTRRETSAPYCNLRSPQKTASSNVPSSLSASVCMAATATTAPTGESSDGTNHAESSSDPSNAYCKPNIEQDTVAV